MKKVAVHYSFIVQINNPEDEDEIIIAATEHVMRNLDVLNFPDSIDVLD